jgi:hypothetical protein
VSQGNPFFLLVQLLVGCVLSVVFIVLPLKGRNPIQRRGAKRFFTYFAGVGLGFIMIEVSLIQKLTVFLGHPIYSITVTLAGVLFFAGLGALLSANGFETTHAKSWFIPLGLAALIGSFFAGWPVILPQLIVLDLPVRVAVAVAVIAPIGLLLGVPFAYGLRRLNAYNPTLVPWAWAINGCFSVMGSILTVIVSMTVGFSFTIALAVSIYLLAFAALTGVGRIGGTREIHV